MREVQHGGYLEGHRDGQHEWRITVGMESRRETERATGRSPGAAEEVQKK